MVANKLAQADCSGSPASNNNPKQLKRPVRCDEASEPVIESNRIESRKIRSPAWKTSLRL
jgi:hypothetical protein